MFRKFTFALLALMFALSACGPVLPLSPTALPTQAATPALAATASPISLTDGLGRTVILSQPAQHIVSMAPSNTEILFAIGAGAQVAGRDTFSDYPEAAKALPDIGGSMGKFSTEQIVALKPDLVLASELNTPEQVKSLVNLGVTVYYLKNPTTLEGLYTNLEIVGKLSGQEAKAATLVGSLKARIAAVDAKIATVTDKPSVFYELDSTDPAKPYTAGPGSFVDQLIARAGGSNIGAILQGQWAQISLEQLVVANPHFILLGDAAYGTTPASLLTRPGWQTLSAIKENRVLPFDDNTVSRPGPRLVDGLEALAKILHPELFK
jgi:iron complex transport system substrate-binding protein